MNKNEFLDELRRRLDRLPNGDIARSLDYYTEMIDDRMEDGLLEEEAVAAVGTPSEVAAAILQEMPLIKLVKARKTPQTKRPVWVTVLLILGSPLWLSLVIAAFAVVLSIAVTVWSVLFALWVSAVAFCLCAPLGLLYLPVYAALGSFGTGVFLLGAGLFLSGVGLFLLCGCKKGTGLLLRGHRGLFRLCKCLLIGKEAVQ